MSKFGKNIKKIRKVKKLSQTAFAELFDMTRASVGAYEEERAEPRIDTIISIAKYFSVPIEEILTKELTINDIYNFDIFKEDLLSGDKKRKSVIGNNVMVPFLPREQYAEYLKHLHEKDFLDQLPFISIPFPQSGIGLAIEHDSGDMNFHERGIYQSDIVFCSRLGENFTEQVQNSNIYGVISDDNIFLRRVLVREPYLLLFPDNPNYETISLPVEKIRELWEPRLKMSRHLNQLENNALRFEEIDSRLRILENQMTKNKQ